MAPPTYVYSGNCYVATADQTTFPLTSSAGNAITYLDKSHIKVRTSDDDGVTWTSLTNGTDFTFANPAVSIILTTPVAAGTWVDIQRHTPLGSIYVQFQAGSLLTAEQLNEAERYSLYCDQEIVDGNVDFDPGDIGLDSTDDLPEGSVNLYYTDARVEAWVNANLADTDDLTEGSTNLYYTDARVEAWIDANLADTDALDEGSTNLYYTDARVEAYVSGAGYIKDAGVTKIVAGDNVSITPAAGTGEVTINSAGGGSGAGVVYRGLIDATQTAPSALLGDLYINTATSGTVDASWTGAAGTALTGGERLLYNSSNEWDLLPIPPSQQTLQEVLTTGNTSDRSIVIEDADNFTQIDGEGIEIQSNNPDAHIRFANADLSENYFEIVNSNGSYVEAYYGVPLKLDAADGVHGGLFFSISDVEIFRVDAGSMFYNGPMLVGSNSDGPVGAYNVTINSRVGQGENAGVTVKGYADGAETHLAYIDNVGRIVSRGGEFYVGSYGTADSYINLQADGNGTFTGKINAAGYRIDQLTTLP